MASSIILGVSSYILIAMSPCTLGEKVVLRAHPELTYVPQNITIDVTDLDLAFNDIQILHNTSFYHYVNLHRIKVNYNPIWKIGNGTFDNNFLLTDFRCHGCRLQVLPSSFGPVMNTIMILYLGGAISDMNILISPYFDRFTSLEYLDMEGCAFDDIGSINIPPSVRYLHFASNRLERFPNVSSQRFPVLETLRLDRNRITNISDSELASVSRNLFFLDLSYNKLTEIGDPTPLYRVSWLWLNGNELETIPDMLDGAPLYVFRIEYNTRMACDHRMCWRRLYERVRSWIRCKDDVKCMAPPVARGAFAVTDKS